MANRSTVISIICFRFEVAGIWRHVPIGFVIDPLENGSAFNWEIGRYAAPAQPHHKCD